jgi:hypothetical protein
MSNSFPTLLLRGALLAVFLAIVAAPCSFGQQASPYKPLHTATATAVYDTLSGVSLTVYKSNPLPKHGSLSINQISVGGVGVPHIYQVAYTPDAGFVGVDTFSLEFQYVAAWPYLSYQGYRVSVRPTALVARGDYAISNGGAAVNIPVLDNDSSPAGGLSITEVPLAVNGSASIVGGNQILFSPRPGYVGTAHLNYVVCDAQNHCSTAQVNIGVNNGASPVNDTLDVATTKNTSLSIPLIYNGYTLHQAPAYGSVLMSDGKSFRYTPGPNFSGSDQFVLSKNNGNGANVFKTVKVIVVNTPGQNRMAMDDVVFTPKGQPVTFNVRSNDIGSLTVKSWTAPSTSAGTLSGTNATGNVTFTPSPSFNGVATFSYKIGNNFVPDLEIANVSVVVGNLPPAQAVYNMSTPKATPFVVNHRIPFSGFQFTLAAAPGHGACTIYPGYSTQTLNGQSVSGYNLVVYAPDAGFTGSDEFKLNYCIPASGQCQSVTVRMEVVNVSSAPGPYCAANCVWAGDANDDGIVNNKDLLPLGYFMGFEGASRNQAAQEWYGQSASNWNNPFTGSPTDLKFVDSDGDGLISSADTGSIHYFYGQTHQFAPKVPATSKGLPFKLKMLTPPNPGVGDWVQIEVSLGSPAKPLTNLYGFTFEMSLSPEIVDSALQMNYYDNSWLNLNSPSLWMSKTPAERRLETAFTRTNGISITGQGTVGRADFVIIDILDVGKNGLPTTVRLAVDGPTLLWGDGSASVGERMELEIPLRLGDAPAALREQDLFVYPSPASERLQIHLNGTDVMQSISLFDALGRLVRQCDAPQPEHHVLDVSTLPAGMYVVQVRTATGVVAKKVEKM